MEVRKRVGEGKSKKQSIPEWGELELVAFGDTGYTLSFATGHSERETRFNITLTKSELHKLIDKCNKVLG